MQLDKSSRDEWQRGWRVILGSMIASGFGMPLFYYVFSLFTLPMIDEFGITRGELSNLQALIVFGALTAPLVGRWLDRSGFRMVFAACSVAIVIGHLAMAGAVVTAWQFAIVAFIYGAAGVGCGPLGYTRLVNGWFWHSRGLALGVVALGVALTAIFVPQWIAGMIERDGWRSGFWALAAMAGLLSLPLTLLLVRNHPAEGPAGPTVESVAIGDRTFMKSRDFWLLVGAMICMAIPGAGILAHLSPIVQEEGIGVKVAAFGVTAFAIGQVTGRIIAGWFLDRANPRIVAFIFTAVPAVGFVLLAGLDLGAVAAVLAVGMVGVQQGAEIDLFAWFTARRFGLARYGAIYGWVIAASWIGNALGILTFGWAHDAGGNYKMIEWIAAGLLVLGAILIAAVRVTVSSHNSPEPLPAP